MLVAGVDLQRCCLLFQRTDDDAVADGDDRLFSRMATAFSVAIGRAGRGADVLALVTKASRALPDLEAACFAKIVAPRIDALIDALAWARSALAELLGTDQDRGFLQRKANLRIGDEIGTAAAPARAAVGDDVSARAIGEVGRSRLRPLGGVRGNIETWARRLAAGNTQRLQETLGNRVSLATGQPPRPRRRVQALDRHDIGHAEAGEGIAHIAFANEAAHVRELRRQRLDRLAFAAERIGKIVDEDRARDLHLDRAGEGSGRQARAPAGEPGKHPL